MDYKKFYNRKNAIVIMGGSSILKYINILHKIDRKRNILFAESKCLGETLLKEKISPDFLIAPYAEKLKDNYLQNYIFRSIVVGANIKKYIRKIHFSAVDEIINNLSKYIETWKPHRGIHKKFKYKKNLYLKNSPYSYLNLFPNTKIILNMKNFKENFERVYFKNKIIKLNIINNTNKKKLKNHINIVETDILNSAGIVCLPMLKYLGFKKIFLLGMDMNFLGSLEFNVNKIFKSFFHFSIFFFKIRKTFNAEFKTNLPFYFLRPKKDFYDLSELVKKLKLNVLLVNTGSFFEKKINNVKIINYKIFKKKIGAL